jgi:hypothetical protein
VVTLATRTDNPLDRRLPTAGGPSDTVVDEVRYTLRLR